MIHINEAHRLITDQKEFHVNWCYKNIIIIFPIWYRLLHPIYSRWPFPTFFVCWINKSMYSLHFKDNIWLIAWYDLTFMKHFIKSKQSIWKAAMMLLLYRALITTKRATTMVLMFLKATKKPMTKATRTR